MKSHRKERTRGVNRFHIYAKPTNISINSRRGNLFPRFYDGLEFLRLYGIMQEDAN